KLSEDERLQQRRKQRKELALQRSVTGEAAFVLSDTYGFPIDLTQLIARERGFSVDREAFDQFVARQKEIGKEDHGVNVQVIELSKTQTSIPTQFVGYEHLETPAKVLELVREKENTAVIFDKSPLYAEMGGQVGDTGELIGNGQLWHICNTQKSGNAWLHILAENG